jgi:hypothetical protein
MIEKTEHIAWAAEAVAVFQKRCGTSDEHAIADLILEYETAFRANKVEAVFCQS